jgi:D-glycero-beta-D-manno-heptose-7-phosphate kinase
VGRSRRKVLVTGDVMVDSYTYVTSSRSAQESENPVWDEVSSEVRPGGAANVAHALSAIGGDDFDVYLAGIVGVGFNLTIKRMSRVNMDLCVAGETMVKERYVHADSRRHLFRSDNFVRFSPENVKFFEMMSWNVLDREFDAVVISDYDKGTITEGLAGRLSSHPLCVVDSKRLDLRAFSGAKILKVNEEEYSAQVSNGIYPCVERLFENCVVTRGSKSTELRQCERQRSTDTRYVVHTESFPVRRSPVVDVTGCGDVHTASMVVSMLRDGGDVRAAVCFANDRAADAVGVFGTGIQEGR